MQTPLAITRVCLESKGSLQISWLALACASMKKTNIFKGTNKTLHNMFQSRGSVSFPLWGKGYSRSWNSWNSPWRGWCHTVWDVGTPNHRATAAMLSARSTRGMLHRGAWPRRSEESPAPLPLRDTSHALKAAADGRFTQEEKHTGRSQKKIKAAVLPDSHLWWLF